MSPFIDAHNFFNCVPISHSFSALKKSHFSTFYFVIAVIARQLISVDRYEIVYKQAVSSEDMFLQMGNKTPLTSSCEDMVVSLQ
jgi:hypothetical protein